MEIDGWEVYIIMFWDHVGGFMKKKNIQKIGHNRAPRGACTWLGARGLVHVAWCTWLGARVPCTIVMAIDGCEVYIVMF